VSDDIPLIFAEQLASPEAHTPCILFLSAAATSQMQQYATAGWRVLATPDFKSTGQVDLGAVPAHVGDDAGMSPDIVSVEGTLWPSDARTRLQQLLPGMVKVNCAFHGLDDHRCDEIAATLQGVGYTLLATHWRDDNTYGLGSLARLDLLGAYAPRDWKRLNIIAVRDRARARSLIILGRLYVGEERRIADLRIANAVRSDHIARLEDALMAHQRRT
jgi:hypothetical protein